MISSSMEKPKRNMTGIWRSFTALPRGRHTAQQDEVPDRAQLDRLYGTPSDTHRNETRSGEGESHFGHGSSRGHCERPAIHWSSKLSRTPPSTLVANAPAITEPATERCTIQLVECLRRSLRSYQIENCIKPRAGILPTRRTNHAAERR